MVEFVETKLALEFKGLLPQSSELRSLIWDTPARAVYFMTVVLALSDVDSLESFLGASPKSVRKDATLRTVGRFLKAVRGLIEAQQDTESAAPKEETTPEAKEAESEPKPSNRGRPFQARLPKSEVATFMTAKASSCKQARKLPAMNIARAVYAEFGQEVSVYGCGDCNSFCRAVAGKVDEVTVADVLVRAASFASSNCELDVDQLYDILLRVPLVVACSVYVAELLGVTLEAIDAANKNLKENDAASKAAIFISYVANADFSDIRHDDVQIVDDIVESVSWEVWPWGEEDAVDTTAPAPSCLDMDPDDMALEDLIAYVTYFKLLTDDEAAATEAGELRRLVSDHQDEAAEEEEEDSDEE
jgi:hypothetical protein